MHRPAPELWHRGLRSWDHPTGSRPPNIYYAWVRSHFSCPGYASYGCWKARVVTRTGCRNGVTILVAEWRDGAEVATTVGSSRPVAPRKPAVVEVDADKPDVSGQVESMGCS